MWYWVRVRVCGHHSSRLASNPHLVTKGDIGAELKRIERIDAKQLSENKLFSELKMSKKEHHTAPLVSGTFE